MCVENHEMWCAFRFGMNSNAASRCTLVLFERYGRPKKCEQKSSCNTFSIYISRKN